MSNLQIDVRKPARTATPSAHEEYGTRPCVPSPTTPNSSPGSSRSELPSVKKYTRYYAPSSGNLTSQDRSALAQGEHNHNLSPWTQSNLLRYHQNRKDLIPTAMPKIDKVETLASIEHDIQKQQRIVAKGMKKPARLNLQNIRRLTGLGTAAYTNNKTTQMAFAQSAMSAGSSRVTIPGEPASAPMFNRQFSFESRNMQTTGYRGSMLELARGFEAFNVPGARQSLPLTFASSPIVGPSIQSSGTASSSASLHLHNPNTTFDDFLAPHKSGRGEAFRGAQNAKMMKADKRKSKAGFEEQYLEWFKDGENGVQEKTGLKRGLRKMIRRRG